MQNKFESNFTQKLYKKKLEEIRKFHRSIAKFKKIYKMKNEDFDNLSDKRFKDIVEAYKRNHISDKKHNTNIKHQKEENLQEIKRSRSQVFMDLTLKDKNINLFEANHRNNEDKQNKNKKIQFKTDKYIENNTKIIDIQESNYSRKHNYERKNESINKNSIHLLDFTSHPSKFFNQN